MKTKHLTLEYDAPKFAESMQTYDYVRVLRGYPEKSKAKVLFVLDHMPTEDLESGKIFSGTTGQVFLNQVQYLEDTYPLEATIDDLDFLVVSYNMFKTYDKGEQFKNDADLEFANHLKDTIVSYKPDYVMTFGPQPFKALNAEKIQYVGGAVQNWLGVPIKTRIKHGKKSHRFEHISNMSFNTLLNPKSVGNTSYLLGYQARCMLPIFQLGMKYKIPEITCGKKRNWKLKYITKVKQFERMLKELYEAEVVAVDTETENLNVIVNKILTAQFSTDGKTAYVLPLYHRDSPFSPKELRKMTTALALYFETNNNKIHVYTNAKFDLNIMRNNFGVRHFKTNVWDIQAGMFAFDENLKALHMVAGRGYYNLANLTMQFGSTVYHDVAFGKEQRKTIAAVDLSEDVQEYAGLDVIVPWHIYQQQKRIAKDIKYDKYQSIVGEQISDQLHAFSILESTGAYADIDYLFRLSLLDSPINREIADIEQRFLESPEVLAANKLVCEDQSVPTHGLMGAVTINKFDLSKTEHKQILFFDVMKLTPVEEGEKLRPNGKKEGKLDKKFQEEYKHIQLVSLYTQLGKAHKLRNAYVRSLLKLWGASEDFKYDRSIRPTYNYLKVVTGRTSASNPNLQQLPSRSELGKLIKRIFVARKGCILIKVDYSAHEVRGWSIISGDKEVAEVFEQGARHRERFKLVPDSWIKHLIGVEGDVHKINAAYFFGIDIMAVTKTIRDAVKAVIFGLIYQQGDAGLAASTGRTEKEIVKIKSQFLGRFPTGYKWFDIAKNFAKRNFFIESPLGRRRHLWGYLIPSSSSIARSVHKRCERQSVNSPVQGLGSDFMMTAIRILDRKKYEYYQAHGVYPDFKLNVSVHDSLTVDAPYRWVMLALKLIQESMTDAAAQEFEKRHNMECTSVPEIDFDLGTSEKDVKGWDFSYTHLKELVRYSLEQRKAELNDTKLDVEKVLDTIMEDQYDDMPEWLQKQLWANKINLRSMPKRNPLTDKEKELVKLYHDEKPDNAARYAAWLKAEGIKEVKTSVNIRISKSMLKKAMAKYLK